MAGNIYTSDSKVVGPDNPLPTQLMGSKATDTILSFGSSPVTNLDAYAKRDTTSITTNPVILDGQKTKRLLLGTVLDQGFTVNTLFSKDGGLSWISIGGAKTIAANAGWAVFTEADFVALNLIKGQVRFLLSGFAAAPTTGTLTITLQIGTM